MSNEIKEYEEVNGFRKSLKSRTYCKKENPEKTYRKKVREGCNNTFYNNFYTKDEENPKTIIQCHKKERPTIYTKIDGYECGRYNKSIKPIDYKEYIEGIKDKEIQILDSNYQNELTYSKINRNQKKLRIKKKENNTIMYETNIFNKTNNYNEYYNEHLEKKIKNYKNGRISSMMINESEEIFFNTDILYYYNNDLSIGMLKYKKKGILIKKYATDDYGRYKIEIINQNTNEITNEIKSFIIFSKYRIDKRKNIIMPNSNGKELLIKELLKYKIRKEDLLKYNILEDKENIENYNLNTE